MLLCCQWENCWEVTGGAESLEPRLWGQGTKLGSSLTLWEGLGLWGPGWQWAKVLLPNPQPPGPPSSPQPLERGLGGRVG